MKHKTKTPFNLTPSPRGNGDRIHQAMKRSVLVLGLTVLGLAACQTTGENSLYTKESVASKPYRSNYSSDLSYAVDLAIHLYPRKCRWVKTEDSQRVGEIHSPEKFTFNQIIADQNVDGWFAATMGDIEASHLGNGTTSFYVNSSTGAWACGDRNLARIASHMTFQNGKFYDVQSVPGAKTSSRPKPRPNTTVPEINIAASLPAGLLCKNAIKNGDQWETRTVWQNHVAEAKRRGFSLEDCIGHFKKHESTKTSAADPASNSHQLALKQKGMSDDTICKKAFYNGKWESMYGGNGNFVAIAQERGLTLEQCARFVTASNN